MIRTWWNPLFPLKESDSFSSEYCWTLHICSLWLKYSLDVRNAKYNIRTHYWGFCMPRKEYSLWLFKNVMERDTLEFIYLRYSVPSDLLVRPLWGFMLKSHFLSSKTGKLIRLGAVHLIFTFSVSFNIWRNPYSHSLTNIYWTLACAKHRPKYW